MIHLAIFALIVLLIVAIFCYAINAFLPVNTKFKQLICFVIVVIGVLVVLSRLIGFA